MSRDQVGLGSLPAPTQSLSSPAPCPSPCPGGGETRTLAARLCTLLFEELEREQCQAWVPWAIVPSVFAGLARVARQPRMADELGEVRALSAVLR